METVGSLGFVMKLDTSWPYNSILTDRVQNHFYIFPNQSWICSSIARHDGRSLLPTPSYLQIHWRDNSFLASINYQHKKSYNYLRIIRCILEVCWLHLSKVLMKAFLLCPARNAEWHLLLGVSRDSSLGRWLINTAWYAHVVVDFWILSVI